MKKSDDSIVGNMKNGRVPRGCGLSLILLWRWPVRKEVLLGLDAHVRHCVLAGRDGRGKLLFHKQLATSEAALISCIVSVEARRKVLTFEESSLADWLSGGIRTVKYMVKRA